MNNPLFAGNPQLQEQFRAQLPIFLQQVLYTFHSNNSVLHLDITFPLKSYKDSPGNIIKDSTDWPIGGRYTVTNLNPDDLKQICISTC